MVVNIQSSKFLFVSCQSKWQSICSWFRFLKSVSCIAISRPGAKYSIAMSINLLLVLLCINAVFEMYTLIHSDEIDSSPHVRHTFNAFPLKIFSSFYSCRSPKTNNTYFAFILIFFLFLSKIHIKCFAPLENFRF